MALARRNVKVDSLWCNACISEVETSDHILVKCPFADLVWRSVDHWCGTGWANGATVKEIIAGAVNLNMGSKRKKKALLTIIYGAIWAIWRARNDRLFNSVYANPIKVVDAVKSMTFLWIKHRFGKVSLDWDNWILSPFNCL